MNAQSKRTFLTSFNHFRALAIVLIVAGHTTELAGIKFDSFLENTVGNLINDSTNLFVFISGVLFHHVYYHRFVYKVFIRRKAETVLAPYLVIGISLLTIFLILKVGTQSDFGASRFSAAGPDPSFGDYLMVFLQYLATGQFFTAYWYIPFILATFLMAPLHARFVTLRLNTQVAMIAALLFVSMLMQRPVDNVLVPQSVLYFLPVYLFGILCSIHKEDIYFYLEGKAYLLLIGAVLIAVVQAINGYSESFHKAPFAFAGLDPILIQKMLLCLFFMVWLHKFEHINPYALDTLAKTSFAIFFLHPVVLLIAYKVRAELGLEGIQSWLAFPFLVALIVLLCVAIALTAKRVLGKRSRYLIGY